MNNNNIEYGFDFTYFYDTFGRDAHAFQIPPESAQPYHTAMDHVN